MSDLVNGSANNCEYRAVVENTCENTIPDVLIEYIDQLAIQSEENRMKDVYGDKAIKEKVIDNIKGIMTLASHATNLSFIELLTRCDFHKENLTSSHLDSVLSELRTLCFLAKSGFTNITPLIAENGVKQADIVADYGTKLWVIEVSCMSFTNKNWNFNELNNYIVQRYRINGKYKQLQDTSERFGREMQLLVLVINAAHINALIDRHDLITAMRIAHEEMGLTDKQHIGIITGMVTLGIGPDECIYPELFEHRSTI